MRGKEWVMRGQNLNKVDQKKQVEGPKQVSEHMLGPNHNKMEA